MDLYKIILLLLSLIFSFLLQIKLTALRLWNVKKQLRSYAIRLFNNLWPRSVLTYPSIVPGHLTLIINESQVNLNEICKLLVLACKYGIRQVSIYEPRGYFGNVDCLTRLGKLLMRKSRSRFEYRLLLRPPVAQDWPCIGYRGKIIKHHGGNTRDMDDVIATSNDVIDNDVISIDSGVSSSFNGSGQSGYWGDVIKSENNVITSRNDVITWENYSPSAHDVNIDQNHFLPPTLHVYLLGANAGRWAIAQAAQASIKRSLLAEKFEFFSFLNTLTHFSSPEADFALIFGKVPSMVGYPPLALRLTELLFLPTHQSITEANFVDWLETFNKRDRRRGK